MEFAVLGPLEVTRDGAAIHIGSRMQRRLLALLLVSAGAPVSADRAVDVLWAGEPPPSAAKGLHAYVSRLRGALGDGAPLLSDANGYRLAVTDQQIDSARFTRLVQAARSHLEDDPRRAADELAGALALWRGPAYGEFAAEGFAQPEAVRLDELRLTAHEDAFAARLACGDTEVVGDLEAFTAANPFRERPYGHLMTALSLAGRQSEALAVYQRVRARFADELGLEPSPALAQLQADILRQAPAVTASTVTAPKAAADHAPASPRNQHRPGNLPQPVTSFVGRENALAELRGRLARDRLVTLTGVGGVGKSRLAMEAAASVADRHPDGVWWCELAPADASAVDHAVAAVLGTQLQADASILDSIGGALVGKRVLLVLDNCEHVIDASARLVEHVLRRCPEVTILATSREPLTVPGEQVWVVPPLPLPPEAGGHLATSAAAALFRDRAAGHGAEVAVDEKDAAAIAEICRQLDGLPLAIELAAALVPAVAPGEIARRLGQRFGLLRHGPRTQPRHRSLTAVVEWSYGLLDADEQQLFDRLAVFAGGFTLAAVEGICADDALPSERIAGLLAGLVSRSMVEVDHRAGSARYRLLETLRHYAATKLAERDEERPLHERHATWFADLTERADVAVRGPDEAAAVARFEAELANLRTAHRWAVAQDDAGTALRLAASLYTFATWRLRDEVFDWAEEAAELPGAEGHPLRPTVWGAVAIGLSSRGELDRARVMAERALTAASQVGQASPFTALVALWAIAIYEGRLADHRAHAREGLVVAELAGDAYGAVWAQVHGVLSRVYGGDREAGLRDAQDGLTAADELGNPGQRAWARYMLAEAYGDDDPDQALALLADALELAGPVGDRFLEGVARVATTSLLARHRSPREALAAFPEVINHWRRAGDWTHQWTTLRNLVPLLVALDADAAAAQLYAAQAAGAVPAYGVEADRLRAAAEQLSVRLGTQRFEALVSNGQQLDGAAALDLALTTIDELLSR